MVRHFRNHANEFHDAQHAARPSSSQPWWLLIGQLSPEHFHNTKNTTRNQSPSSK
jgi:hypothetical protein